MKSRKLIYHMISEDFGHKDGFYYSHVLSAEQLYFPSTTCSLGALFLARNTTPQTTEDIPILK